MTHKNVQHGDLRQCAVALTSECVHVSLENFELYRGLPQCDPGDSRHLALGLRTQGPLAQRQVDLDRGCVKVHRYLFSDGNYE